MRCFHCVVALSWIAAAWLAASSPVHAVYTQGIDISHYQGNITATGWEQIKSAGIRFAFIKVTDGACCDVDILTSAHAITAPKPTRQLY